MKNFWKKMKRVLKLMFFASAAVLFFILLGSAVKNQNDTICKKVTITIDHQHGNFFVDEMRVRNHIEIAAQDSIEGKMLSEIPFKKISEVVKQDPYVKDVEVFSNIKGEVHIHVKQKLPFIRIINKNGVSYYLDQYGSRIPLSDNFTANVVVANGNIEENDSLMQKNLFDFAKFIREENFWNAQIEQIYVNDQKEFDLIPRIGDQVIQFGTAEKMEKKFSDLFIFYTEGLSHTGWDQYKTITLKYDGQIVCTKK